MSHLSRSIQRLFTPFILTLAAAWLAGCQSAADRRSTDTSTPVATIRPAPATSAPVAATPAPATAPATTTAPAATAAPATATASKSPAPPVRIKAGLTESLTDADGNVWLPEQGFTEGLTTDRPDLKIENTKTPAIYFTEHYSMTSFTYPVPNGKYTLKLHFCETYEGITGPGQRVFTFNAMGQEYKDFDIWVKSGGFLHAYIVTQNVEVTDGKILITFTPQVENPQINGIEILPAT
jgi:hypothetical protein